MRSWVLLCAAALAGCDNGSPDTAAPRAAADWFSEHGADAGLTFTHVNGMSGRFYEAEIFSPGVALFDYDNDGDLDAYVVQGQALGADAPPAAAQDRLFRNDLAIAPDGTRVLRFTDVTAASGIGPMAYGMGVAAADVDNDGWVDLYLTRLGPDVLLHNNGNGTFTDITKQSGLGDPAWGVSASFVDIDRDGWLDLYVGNYLRYGTDTDLPCTTVTGRPDYCPPAVYDAAPDRLYRNRGDGTFADVTARALVNATARPALGVSTADFNGDGWMDIYVANDGAENVLWINQRNWTFKDLALIGGAALTASGDATASMGVDAGDFDNDGDEDIVIANLTSEGHTLFTNDGTGLFEDWGARSRIRPLSLAYTGFGAAWLDADNDGWLDVISVNGAVRIIEALAARGDAYPLAQPRVLLRNLGTGQFEDTTGRAGAPFARATVARGAAFGDVDNDGDMDVLVGSNNGPLELLINDVGNRQHWIGIRAIGRAQPRDMLGARVGVVRADGRTVWRRVRSDGSYASANDPRVLVGLGAAAGVTRVRIAWPGGRTEEWTGVAPDRWTTLEEGSGRPVDD
jgi:hypothetical protein